MSSTDDKVRTLTVVTPAQETCAETIQILREALAEAERGEIHEMFLLAKTADGYRQLASPTHHFAEWIGRLETTKTEWVIHFLLEDEA